MSEYVAVEPFGVDDGELDTVTPSKAFTLGVEWEMVRTLVRTGEEFCVYAIHTDNRRRISALLSRHGYHQQWNEGDDWSFVTTIREGTSHD